jgi:hypothetical protein
MIEFYRVPPMIALLLIYSLPGGKSRKKIPLYLFSAGRTSVPLPLWHVKQYQAETCFPNRRVKPSHLCVGRKAAILLHITLATAHERQKQCLVAFLS